MTKNSKLTILTILGLIGIIVFTITLTPTNCWDNYQTENDAIMHCEEH
jgi:hypothetical protein